MGGRKAPRSGATKRISASAPELIKKYGKKLKKNKAANQLDPNAVTAFKRLKITTGSITKTIQQSIAGARTDDRLKAAFGIPHPTGNVTFGTLLGQLRDGVLLKRRDAMSRLVELLEAHREKLPLLGPSLVKALTPVTVDEDVTNHCYAIDLITEVLLKNVATHLSGATFAVLIRNIQEDVNAQLNSALAHLHALKRQGGLRYAYKLGIYGHPSIFLDSGFIRTVFPLLAARVHLGLKSGRQPETVGRNPSSSTRGGAEATNASGTSVSGITHPSPFDDRFRPVFTKWAPVIAVTLLNFFLQVTCGCTGTHVLTNSINNGRITNVDCADKSPVVSASVGVSPPRESLPTFTDMFNDLFRSAVPAKLSPSSTEGDKQERNCVAPKTTQSLARGNTQGTTSGLCPAAAPSREASPAEHLVQFACSLIQGVLASIDGESQPKQKALELLAPVSLVAIMLLRWVTAYAMLAATEAARRLDAIEAPLPKTQETKDLARVMMRGYTETARSPGHLGGGYPCKDENGDEESLQYSLWHLLRFGSKTGGSLIVSTLEELLNTIEVYNLAAIAATGSQDWRSANQSTMDNKHAVLTDAVLGQLEILAWQLSLAEAPPATAASNREAPSRVLNPSKRRSEKIGITAENLAQAMQTSSRGFSIAIGDPIDNDSRQETSTKQGFDALVNTRKRKHHSIAPSDVPDSPASEAVLAFCGLTKKRNVFDALTAGSSDDETKKQPCGYSAAVAVIGIQDSDVVKHRLNATPSATSAPQRKTSLSPNLMDTEDENGPPQKDGSRQDDEESVDSSSSFSGEDEEETSSKENHFNTDTTEPEQAGSTSPCDPAIPLRHRIAEAVARRLCRLCLRLSHHHLVRHQSVTFSKLRQLRAQGNAAASAAATQLVTSNLEILGEPELDSVGKLPSPIAPTTFVLLNVFDDRAVPLVFKDPLHLVNKLGKLEGPFWVSQMLKLFTTTPHHRGGPMDVAAAQRHGSGCLLGLGATESDGRPVCHESSGHPIWLSSDELTGYLVPPAYPGSSEEEDDGTEFIGDSSSPEEEFHESATGSAKAAPSAPPVHRFGQKAAPVHGMGTIGPGNRLAVGGLAPGGSSAGQLSSSEEEDGSFVGEATLRADNMEDDDCAVHRREEAVGIQAVDADGNKYTEVEDAPLATMPRQPQQVPGFAAKQFAHGMQPAAREEEDLAAGCCQLDVPSGRLLGATPPRVQVAAVAETAPNAPLRRVILEEVGDDVPGAENDELEGKNDTSMLPGAHFRRPLALNEARQRAEEKGLDEELNSSDQDDYYDEEDGDVYAETYEDEEDDPKSNSLNRLAIARGQYLGGDEYPAVDSAEENSADEGDQWECRPSRQDGVRSRNRSSSADSSSNYATDEEDEDGLDDDDGIGPIHSFAGTVGSWQSMVNLTPQLTAGQYAGRMLHSGGTGGIAIYGSSGGIALGNSSGAGSLSGVTAGDPIEIDDSD